MLIEYYLNKQPTDIIEPDTEANRARAIKWASAYSKLMKTDILLSLEPLKRKEASDLDPLN